MLAAWETAPAPAALLEALGARLLAGEAAALAAPDAARALRCLRACGPAAFFVAGAQNYPQHFRKIRDLSGRKK